MPMMCYFHAFVHIHLPTYINRYSVMNPLPSVETILLYFKKWTSFPKPFWKHHRLSWAPCRPVDYVSVFTQPSWSLPQVEPVILIHLAAAWGTDWSQAGWVFSVKYLEIYRCISHACMIMYVLFCALLVDWKLNTEYWILQRIGERDPVYKVHCSCARTPWWMLGLPISRLPRPASDWPWGKGKSGAPGKQGTCIVSLWQFTWKWLQVSIR